MQTATTTIGSLLAKANVGDFISKNSDAFSALALFVGAVIIAKVIDIMIGRQAKRLAKRDSHTSLSQVALTRLRLLRRLVFATIVLVGLGLALNQVDALQPLATALLASSAVLGLAVGFASRQTIANTVAGVSLAALQPFRIGDVIEWEGNRGIVEDLTLTYTFVRLPSGHRLIVPNERIAASPLENYTIAGRAVEAVAAIWVRPSKAVAALDLLREQFPTAQVRTGSCETDRVELKVAFDIDAEHEVRAATETREQALRILASGGMLLDEPALG